MELMTEVVSGVVSGVLTTAVITLIAAIWRLRILRKYRLTNETRQVLEALWDENLLRRSDKIATELSLDPSVVIEALEQLKLKKLVRERNRNKSKFWKITLKGKDYLRQSSWIE